MNMRNRSIVAVPLGAIVLIAKGRKLSESTPSAREKLVRYLQIDDLRSDANLKFTSDNGVEVNEADVVIAWDGANAGTVGYGLKGAIGSTLARLRVVDSAFDTKFLGRFLQTQFGYFQSTATGATIPHVSREALEQLQVPKFPLPDQRRIADILDKSDAIRRKRRQTINFTNQLTDSAFFHLFGDVGTNQKRWAECDLEQLCGRVIDCPHSTPEYSTAGTGYHCVRSSDIQDGKIDLSSTREVSRETFEERISRHRPEVGEVVFTREGGRLGNAAQIPPGLSLCLGQRMMLFACKPSESTNEFIWALLNSPGVQRQVRLLTAGAAAPRINIADIRKFRVVKPPYRVQTEFARIVSKVRIQEERSRCGLDESNCLFNSLVQRGFQGEL